ncbi:MAG: hypothetical protein ACM33T_11330 [Solirubrobacterales bacterium]
MKPIIRQPKQPPMSLELIGVLEHRRSEFERKFGRAPRPGEPLFFDPNASEPRRLPPEHWSQAQATVVALTGLPEKMAATLVARW